MKNHQAARTKNVVPILQVSVFNLVFQCSLSVVGSFLNTLNVFSVLRKCNGQQGCIKSLDFVKNRSDFFLVLHLVALVLDDLDC